MHEVVVHKPDGQVVAVVAEQLLYQIYYRDDANYAEVAPRVLRSQTASVDRSLAVLYGEDGSRVV